MSNFLCDMKEGDEISCQGPFGDFILRPPMRDTIFIATGTGIAPFRSMLHWLLGDECTPPGQAALADLRQSHRERHLLSRRISASGRRSTRTFTTCRHSAAAVRTGRVFAAMCRNMFPPIAQGRTDMHAYVCGLDKMVKANRDLLKSLGWDRKSILYEKYD